MPKVGFIGAGKMGVGVALNLLNAGHDCTVLVRENRQFADELSNARAILTGDLKDCITGQSVVFLCLPSMVAWQEITDCIKKSATPGTIIVDLTSARPDLTAEMARSLAERDIGFVDAPMLKGPPAARAGTIQLLVGGRNEDIDAVMPLLKTVSEAQHQTGGPGTGHALKLLNNAVTLTNSAIVYETFALAATMGINLPLVHTAMRESAAGSKRLDAIAPVLISGDHAPSFDVGTALKDLELYNDMARAEGILTFTGAGARTLYKMGSMMGLANAPVSQLGEMLFDLNSGKIDNVGAPGTINNAYNNKRNSGDA
jgi:3-hydroxyisobutyrate dehydrogenase-like beta-hydroxyacid dehydrogenase